TRQEMHEEFSRVWDAISATRQEMHEEFSRVWDAISATRQEMHEEIRELRTEMREEFSRVWDAISATRQEMHEEFGRLWKGFQEVKEQLSLMSLNLEKLATIVEKQSVDIGDLKGRLLEREWRDKAPAFLSRWFRGLRVIDYPELSRMMEKAEAEGLLTEEEGTQLMVTDVIAEGRLKKDGTVSRVVVEVSWTIGRSDVQRARERAQILSRLGVPTVAIVCGSAIGEQVLHEAAEQNVWVLVDGARKDNRFYSFRSQLLE
ncbi:MAG: hypothetical protein RMK62_09365, partial [Armatimonadota bacterium]|nr:hypothetical protein [Armatimonadota bacterium]